MSSTRADAQCAEPPEGLWLLQAYEPVISFTDPTISGYLHLERDSKNQEVFVGSAPVYISPRSPVLTAFQLTAVFDNKTCSLYGAYMLPLAYIHDTFSWRYDGDKSMVGLYRPLLARAPHFPQHSMHMLQYQGPLDDSKMRQF